MLLQGDAPKELDVAGDVHPWQKLHESLCIPWSEVSTVIHLGGQVPLGEAFEDCVQWLNNVSEGKEKSFIDAGVLQGWKNEILERFRSEYRTFWNMEHTRKVCPLAYKINIICARCCLLRVISWSPLFRIYFLDKRIDMEKACTS